MLEIQPDLVIYKHVDDKVAPRRKSVLDAEHFLRSQVTTALRSGRGRATRAWTA